MADLAEQHFLGILSHRGRVRKGEGLPSPRPYSSGHTRSLRLGAGAEHRQLGLRVLVELYRRLGLDLEADACHQFLIGKSHP